MRRIVLHSVAAMALILTVFIASWSLTSNPNGQSVTHHHSVRYMGFIPLNPKYSNETPDYYVAINNLKTSVMELAIRLELKNQEDKPYYIRIVADQLPSNDWIADPLHIGRLEVDEGKTVVYRVYRKVPQTIPEGVLHENITIAVEAYYDEGYTNLYSRDSFTVTFHFIDHEAPVWTVKQIYDFDDGTSQGWNGGDVSTDYYRSFPYSLEAYSIYRNFEVYGINEAYLIVPFRPSSNTYVMAYIDGRLLYYSDVSVEGGHWYQVVIPIPRGKHEVKVYVESYSRYDDIVLVGR